MGHAVVRSSDNFVYFSPVNFLDLSWMPGWAYGTCHGEGLFFGLSLNASLVKDWIQS